MMSAYGEAQCLKELSRLLKERIQQKSYQSSLAYQLIDVFDDLAIIWSTDDACFYTQIYNSSDSLQKHKPKVQKISLSKPPIWEVQKISVNKSGTGVLIWGSHGLAVVELPKRWGNPCLFEGGADFMACRVVYVGENIFSSSTKLSILSASWHPGCLTHNHVAILSNDNCFRVYNLTSPTKPEMRVAVGKTVNRERSTLNCDEATGELAVDIGFGAAIYPEDYVPSNPLKDDPEEVRRNYLQLQWPAFVLYRNGDVYYIITSLSGNRSECRTLNGPMAMFPAAYDNYGMDYCSLLVLPCSPQVIVIGNTSAHIRHCIVVEKLVDHLDQDAIDSITQGMNKLKIKPPSYILHVYESIKLDLSYVADEPKTESNILLIADPLMPSRYWISHNEGVHGVSFPLVDKLVHMEERNFDLDLLTSTVEHFLCTKPISSVKSLPVIGLAFNQSPSSVLVLLASGLIYTFAIPSSFIPCVSHTNSISADSKKSSTFIGGSFESHIRGLLNRSTSQPLLISGSVPDVESEEYLYMVATVLKTLKQNYMLPQVRVREELQKRVNVLLDQKKNLLSDLQTVLKQKKPLSDRVQTLVERSVESMDRHSKLLTRLEKVMSRIVSDLPTLSGTERAMNNELSAMKERSVGFEQEIALLSSKHKWQADEIAKQRNKEVKETKSLTDSEVNSLQNSLDVESKRLQIMQKKVLQLKTEADV